MNVCILSSYLSVHLSGVVVYYETAMLLAMHSNFPSKCLFLKTATGDYVHSLCTQSMAKEHVSTNHLFFLFPQLAR